MSEERGARPLLSCLFFHPRLAPPPPPPPPPPSSDERRVRRRERKTHKDWEYQITYILDITKKLRRKEHNKGRNEKQGQGRKFVVLFWSFLRFLVRCVPCVSRQSRRFLLHCAEGEWVIAGRWKFRKQESEGEKE